MEFRLFGDCFLPQASIKFLNLLKNNSNQDKADILPELILSL